MTIEQVIEVSIINCLWPGLTLVFSLPILHKKGRITLIPGVVLAFVVAIFWGLYSVLVRRWAGHTEGGAVPLFLLGTGVVLIITRFIFPEESSWTPRVLIELLYMSIFPTFLAYLFWDRAMRKGKIILVVSLSYFTPLLSIIISSLYLQVAIKANLWIACGLVIVGAVICKFSIIDKTKKELISK